MLRSLQVRGLVGPRYRGFRGKLRLAFQELVYRTDVILQLRRHDFQPPAPAPAMTLRWIDRFESLEPYRADLDAAYYQGFLETWRMPFSWGERVALGLVEGRIVAFVWAQDGADGGPVGWFGPILEHECRLSRMGVPPWARGRAHLTALLGLLIPGLFAGGAERLYSEVTLENEPSLKTHVRLGFRAVALVRVAGRLLGGRATIWKGVPGSVVSMLERYREPRG